MKITSKSWRKEFDKDFEYMQEAIDIYFNEHFGSVGKGRDLEKIKFFISQLLKAVVKDLAGRKRKSKHTGHEIDDYYCIQCQTGVNIHPNHIAGFNQHRKEVLERGRSWTK